jgi:hypothetical protein
MEEAAAVVGEAMEEVEVATEVVTLPTAPATSATREATREATILETRDTVTILETISPIRGWDTIRINRT